MIDTIVQTGESDNSAAGPKIGIIFDFIELHHRMLSKIDKKQFLREFCRFKEFLERKYNISFVALGE